MTFQDTATQFEKSDGGTDDFKRLYKEAFELMKSDSANAALYFVIGVAALRRPGGDNGTRRECQGHPRRIQRQDSSGTRRGCRHATDTSR